MRLVYSDPIDELLDLVKQAKQNPKIGHIALTSTELRAALRSERAAEVFPRFVDARAQELNSVRNQLQKIMPMIRGNVLTDREKQPLFDQADKLEEKEESIMNSVPNSLKEDGVTFKISMR